MFDSSPSNLPVEPIPPVVPPVAPPVTAAPAAAPPVRPVEPPASPTGKTEPEDIFVGLDEATKQGAAYLGEEDAPAPVRRSILPFIIIGGVILAVVIAGAVWWFFLRATPVTIPTPLTRTPTTTVREEVERPPVVPTEEPSTPMSSTNIPAPEAIPRPVTSTPVVTPPAPVSVSSTAIAPMGEGEDTDSDRLTNVEERLYGSDPSKQDTDGDTYLDGDEVRNLFSPVSKGKKMTDEPFMTTHNWNGWNILLPTAWTLTDVPDRPGSAVVTTASAARFLFDREANPSRLSLREWLARNQITGEMRPFTTKSGLEAIEMNDGRTTFFALGDTVLALTYDGATDKAFEYRASYSMMVNALSPKL